MLNAPINNGIQRIRSLSTSDNGLLSHFQPGKNRLYTQLTPGEFHARYDEVNLDHVQLFTESINLGTKIQATPGKRFLPFAAITSNGTLGSFYGCDLPDKPFIQATGGEWDIQVSNQLQYVCTAFEREHFYTQYQRLTGQAFPKSWLSSRVACTADSALIAYRLGVQRIIILLQQNPILFQYQSISKLLSDTVMTLVLNVLTPTLEKNEKLKPFSKRKLGVRRVIEFLDVNAHQLPTISELCQVANLSERSLQYGFREMLGVTPIQYLRIVRLNGAHRDLIRADHQSAKVVNIALKWGFLEFGRFAKEYRHFYNQLPSQTLKQAH
ncbi:helix-turn-helix domain-containing protein [Vibrio sp. Makdt]|uniref:helix-turn-helix domain-containing protein n=1 Tax=Vibrio sp. Makdt TaxID=2998828 RepID=UPI0022CD5AED|nr:helix-turn-helix domain-containing protein [Vibrio sp. Makdt]MDA0155718.1 helix-turn-helix domain-containing protein [Vibrio sp. Makdt]CAH7126231.1 Transcriptional regulator EutR [Vibrio chagasii]